MASFRILVLLMMLALSSGVFADAMEVVLDDGRNLIILSDVDDFDLERCK
jgi:hypothetical protein